MWSGYRYYLFLGFFLLSAVSAHPVFSQCLQVNVGVIVDQEADPCDGPITLDAHYPGFSHQWNTGDASQKILVTKSGVYIVEVDDGKGCKGSDTVAVTFMDIPSFDLGPDPAAQCGGCITLDAGNDPGLTYEWSTGETTPSVKYCQTGNHRVKVTLTNAFGCMVSDSVNVTITPGLNVNLGPDISSCDDKVILKTSLNGATYLWNTGETSGTIEVDQSGRYDVDVEDGNGCAGHDEVYVTFHSRPDIELGADPEPQCGGCVSLDAGSQSGLDYQWSTGQTASSIHYCTPGIHQVAVKATNPDGCYDTDTVTVTIHPGYDLSLGRDTSLCASILKLEAPSFAGASYLWSTGESSNAVKVTASGKYFVKIYNLQGCNVKDTLTDTIQVAFNAALTPPLEILDEGDCRERKYSAMLVQGATTYTWSVPEGCEITGGQGSPVISVKANGNVSGLISVGASNNNPSCRSTLTSMEVNIGDHPLNIPNAFTPNGDGTNDTWVIRNIHLYPDNELVVLNRWGNVVFRQKSYQGGWDGSDLNEGSYFYKLRVKFCEEEKELTGYITIVR